MDCDAAFYDTTYGKNFYRRPGNHFAPLAPPIPEKDPNLAPGHFANNIIINGLPIQSKTWEKPKIDNVPEEYKALLARLKISNKYMFEKNFTNPDVDINVLENAHKDAKLTTYQSNYSPEEYVSRKDGLKWPRSKLDTSRYKYHETTYRTYYNRVEEISEMRPLSKPFTWQHDVEQLKTELRKIYKSTQSIYYRQICDPRIAKMKSLLEEGKVWVAPLDAHTLRRV